MNDATFVAGHWMFASEYYKISCQMPFVVKDDVVPEEIIKKNNLRYKVIMAAVIVIYLLFGLFNSLVATCKIQIQTCKAINELGYPYLIIMIIGFALSILVGVYLFIAVFKIRSFLLKEGIKQERINVKIMFLHTSTFGLFLIACCISIYSITNLVFSQKTLADAHDAYYISITTSCIISFLS